MESLTVREPEFTQAETALFLANEMLEADRGPHGIPMSVATDTANQFRFVAPNPTVDWASHTLGAAQDAYYKKYDTDKDHPMNRAGHLWGVRLSDTPN